MDPEAFRAAAHAVVDVMADYLASVEQRTRSCRRSSPGSLRGSFPAVAARGARSPGRHPRRLPALIEPNATHWQHPGFFAYFGSTASGPGILGEMLAAALSQNPMLWRTSPIGTELEGVVVDWLRQAVGLPASFDGLLDRHGIDVVAHRPWGGPGGGAGLTPQPAGWRIGPTSGAPRVYASAEAHSSIEKACMTLGIGRAGFVRIPTDDRYELRLDLLAVRAGRGSRRRTDTDRDRGDARDDRPDVGRSGRCDGRPRRTRGGLAPRRRGVRRCDRTRSRLACAVQGLGTRRLGPRQPAQVAVHAVRRLAPADPPDGRAPGGVQLGAGIPADARPGDPGPRLQRIPAPARAALPSAQAVGAPALLRGRGTASAGRPPGRAGSRVRRSGR